MTKTSKMPEHEDRPPPGYVWIYRTPPGFVDGGLRPLPRRELMPEAVYQELLRNKGEPRSSPDDVD